MQRTYKMYINGFKTVTMTITVDEFDLRFCDDDRVNLSDGRG